MEVNIINNLMIFYTHCRKISRGCIFFYCSDCSILNNQKVKITWHLTKFDQTFYNELNEFCLLQRNYIEITLRINVPIVVYFYYFSFSTICYLYITLLSCILRAEQNDFKNDFYYILLCVWCTFWIIDMLYGGIVELRTLSMKN